MASLYSSRTRIAAILSADKSEYVGKAITICGWSRTIRKQGAKLCFISLNDGSTVDSLQIVVHNSVEDFQVVSKCGVGCSFRITGIVVDSPAAGQPIELLCSDKSEGHLCKLLGGCDAAKYPLSKKNHTKEFLREICHLRPRTSLIGCVTRIRSELAFAVHEFFHNKGFSYIHTPIITTADCEGGGEMFQVTTILPPADQKFVPYVKKESDKKETTEQEEKKDEEKDEKLYELPLKADNTLKYKHDFFGKPSYLTVSGQLAVENFCSSLCDVYTFGPTFRAEKSHTSRHLAEFWMIEPELAFADITDNMNCAESLLKACVQWVLNKCNPDLLWLEKNVEEGLIERLKNISTNEFGRITYTEAIDLLSPHTKEFEIPVEWGMDLGSEHERYLTEKLYKKPVIVYNYPAKIKAFYMRLNEDGKTVAAMDVLLPIIGEVIGGSQREERLENLDNAIEANGLEKEGYWWYRELREYGTIPHSGFGLGFERLVMLVTGVENIRDVIPFPRYPNHAEF